MKGSLEIRLTNSKKAMYIKSIGISYSATPTALDTPEDVCISTDGNLLTVAGLKPNTTVSIYDLSGRLRLQAMADDVFAASLPEGMYVICMELAGHRTTRKLIIR